SGPPVTPTKLDILCAHRSFSSAKAARLLGYAPAIDYPEGLTRTLGWMRDAGFLPAARRSLIPRPGQRYSHRSDRVVSTDMPCANGMRRLPDCCSGNGRWDGPGGARAKPGPGALADQ